MDDATAWIKAVWEWLGKEESNWQRVMALTGIVSAVIALIAYLRPRGPQPPPEMEPTPPPSDPGVSADHGSVAIIGPVTNSPITISNGSSSEQTNALLQDIVSRLDQQGISRKAIARFFEILREHHVADEDLPAKLEEIARRHVDLLDRLGALHPEVPENAQRLADARAAIETVDYDRADALLTLVEQAEGEAAERAIHLAVEATESANRHRRAQAAARAERGRVSTARFDYSAAVKHFEEAASLLPTEDEELRRGYLTNSADALQDHGDEKGDNCALEKAINRYREVLPPRNRLPEQWARIQNNLGNALTTLGARENGTERLEEAVGAFRSALLELTRKRVPLQWATTQNNLGTALTTLGERENRTDRLVEAVGAFRSALLEQTRKHMPLQWAMTQNNLGNVLAKLGTRENGTERLEEAVGAFRSALLELTRERVPLQWATTQNNLGTALRTLGERENGTERLVEAVSTYRYALLEWTRERVPLDWAMTQNNLGSALMRLGERESGTERLVEAVGAYRSALLEWTRERVPLQWAGTQNNLGNALTTLGERENGAERLEEAVGAYRSTLLEYTRERVPLQWAMTQNNLSNALQVLAEKKRDVAAARDAISACEQALVVFTEAKASYYIDGTTQNLTLARGLLATLTAEKEGMQGPPALAGGVGGERP